ncbi:MAG: SURF1 family cytochrome oxidase biogenesis protein [Parvularculaceae bacterium]
MLTVLCALGIWQLRRLEWKRDLIAKVVERLAAEPIPFDEAAARADAGEDMEYQPVRLGGAYRHDLAAHVFGTLNGAPGYYAFAPLSAPSRSSGSRRFVYVNRGFVPQSVRQTGGTDPAGEIIVVGLFREAETPTGLASVLQPKDQLKDNLYFVRDPRVLARQVGIKAPAYYIDSNGLEHAGDWPKGGTTRVEFSNRHLGYALTWFGLAASLLVVFAAYSLRKD